MLQASPWLCAQPPLPLDTGSDLFDVFDCFNDSTPDLGHKLQGLNADSSFLAPMPTMVSPPAPPPSYSLPTSQSMPLLHRGISTPGAPMSFYHHHHPQAPSPPPLVPQPVPQPTPQQVPQQQQHHHQPTQQLPPQPPPPPAASRPKEGKAAKSPGGSQRESRASGRQRSTAAPVIEANSDDGVLLAPAPPPVSMPKTNSSSSTGQGKSSKASVKANGLAEGASSKPEPGQRLRPSINGTDSRSLSKGSKGQEAGADGQAAASGGSKGGGGSKKGSKSAGSKGPKLVTRADLKHDLTGRMLKLLWPDDNSWWDGQVASMAMDTLQAVIFYSSTGEEEVVSLSEMVDKKELAWPPGEGLCTGNAKAPSKSKSASAPKADRKRTAPESSQASSGTKAQPEVSKKKARPASSVSGNSNTTGAATAHPTMQSQSLPHASPPTPPQPPQPPQPQPHLQQHAHQARAFAGHQPQRSSLQQQPSGTSNLSGKEMASQAIAALMGGTQEGNSRAVRKPQSRPQPKQAQPQQQQVLPHTSQPPPQTYPTTSTAAATATTTPRAMSVDPYAPYGLPRPQHPAALAPQPVAQPLHSAHAHQQYLQQQQQQQQQQQLQPQGNGVQQLLALGPALVSRRILVYKYPGMNPQPGWHYATVASVHNGLLSVMYGPSQIEHLSPSHRGIVVRPPPNGWQ